MKKTILLLCGLLCASGAFAQQVPTTDRKKEPTERQKRIRQQARQAKQPVKTRATAKKDPNTIDTQDPGTDAVLNSTTGGRNAPKAATKKDSVAVPQAR